VPEHCPPSTNKRPCHVSTGAPSTTTEAREEVSGEARKEACREYKRHARRQGDREGGGDSAPLVHPSTPLCSPLHEQGSVWDACCPVLSRHPFLSPLLLLLIIYYMYY